MGWTFYNAETFNGKVNRKVECDSLFECDSLQVLRSTMVGSVYYAAVQSNKSGQVFAVICLTSSDRRNGYNFGYKDMDETEGPCECKCPIAILNLLTDTDNEYANDWRKRCREYHEARTAQPSLTSLRVGSIVEFTANGTLYRATKTYGTVKYIIQDGIKLFDKIETYWKLDKNYYSASTRCINSWGYTVCHKASKEEEHELRMARLTRSKI